MKDRGVEEFTRHRKAIRRGVPSHRHEVWQRVKHPGTYFQPAHTSIHKHRHTLSLSHTHTHTNMITDPLCPPPHPKEETFSTLRSRTEQEISSAKGKAHVNILFALRGHETKKLQFPSATNGKQRSTASCLPGWYLPAPSHCASFPTQATRPLPAASAMASSAVECGGSTETSGGLPPGLGAPFLPEH